MDATWWRSRNSRRTAARGARSLSPSAVTLGLLPQECKAAAHLERIDCFDVPGPALGGTSIPRAALDEAPLGRVGRQHHTGGATPGDGSVFGVDPTDQIHNCGRRVAEWGCVRQSSGLATTIQGKMTFLLI